MRFIRFLIPAAAMAAVTPSLLTASLNSETGTYVFQRYSAKQYGASPQNWGVAEDKRGIMYFANTDGLLEFDGNSWRMLRIPGRSVRAVAVDHEGTVYVGGAGELGWLKLDSTGTMKFVSLVDRVSRQDRGFADVWRVLPTPDGVYFSAYSRLFRLNKDGTIKAWRPEKRFGRAFYALNALYVTAEGAGLLRMGRDDRLLPVPGGERFANESVNAAVALGGSGVVSADGGALVATTSRLYRLTGPGSSNPGGVEPFSTAADSWLAGALIYSMQVLPGGEISIGTRKGGLVLLSRRGTVRPHPLHLHRLGRRLGVRHPCRFPGRRLARAK